VPDNLKHDHSKAILAKKALSGKYLDEYIDHNNGSIQTETISLLTISIYVHPSKMGVLAGKSGGILRIHSPTGGI
jgi:hypothetical protein